MLVGCSCCADSVPTGAPCVGLPRVMFYLSKNANYASLDPKRLYFQLFFQFGGSTNCPLYSVKNYLLLYESGDFNSATFRRLASRDSEGLDVTMSFGIPEYDSLTGNDRRTVTALRVAKGAAVFSIIWDDGNKVYRRAPDDTCNLCGYPGYPLFIINEIGYSFFLYSIGELTSKTFSATISSYQGVPDSPSQCTCMCPRTQSRLLTPVCEQSDELTPFVWGYSQSVTSVTQADGIVLGLRSEPSANAAMPVIVAVNNSQTNAVRFIARIAIPVQKLAISTSTDIFTNYLRTGSSDSACKGGSLQSTSPVVTAEFYSSNSSASSLCLKSNWSVNPREIIEVSEGSLSLTFQVGSNAVATLQGGCAVCNSIVSLTVS